MITLQLVWLNRGWIWTHIVCLQSSFLSIHLGREDSSDHIGYRYTYKCLYIKQHALCIKTPTRSFNFITILEKIDILPCFTLDRKWLNLDLLILMHSAKILQLVFPTELSSLCHLWVPYTLLCLLCEILELDVFVVQNTKGTLGKIQHP